MNANSRPITPSTPAPPTPAQIAALAHELWLERGSPRGSDIDIWLEAERQLTGHPRVGKPSAVDPIPANLDTTDADSDIALRNEEDDELGNFGSSSDRRSPTSFGL